MKSAQVDTGRRSRARALGMRFVRKLIWMLIVLWGITVVSFLSSTSLPARPPTCRSASIRWPAIRCVNA